MGLSGWIKTAEEEMCGGIRALAIATVEQSKYLSSSYAATPEKAIVDALPDDKPFYCSPETRMKISIKAKQRFAIQRLMTR